METQKVDLFIIANSKYFESHHLTHIKDILLKIDESKWGIIQTLQFKDPTTSIIVSLLAGTFGVDRFLIGDTALGIGKLLTCGGMGIWTVIDWLIIMRDTKVKNMTFFLTVLN